MADCTKYMALLSELLDGELSEAQTAELHAHMNSCPDCRRVFEAFKALSEAQPRELAAVPEGFTENVMLRVKMAENMRKKKKPHVWGYVATAACLTLAVFGVWKSGVLEFAPTKPAIPEQASLSVETPENDSEDWELKLNVDIDPVEGSPATGGEETPTQDNGEIEYGAATQFGVLTGRLNSNFASNEDYVASELERLGTAAKIEVYEGAFLPDDAEFAESQPIISGFDEEGLQELHKMMAAEALFAYDDEAAAELEPLYTLVFSGVINPETEEPQDIVVVVWIIDDELVFKVETETPILFVSSAFPNDFEEFIKNLTA